MFPSPQIVICILPRASFSVRVKGLGLCAGSTDELGQSPPLVISFNMDVIGS